MTTMTLEALGFTKDELQEKLLDRLCAKVLEGVSYDEDGEQITDNSAFSRKLKESVKKRVDETISAVAEKHLLPNVTDYIENLCLQETNRWGEAKGEKVTFTEYLVHRADAYIREEVDHNGKTKSEDSYNWRKHTTRIAYLIHQHLQYHMAQMMEAALKTANKSIAGGIEQAVKIQLEQVLGKLKLDVKV